MSCARNLPPGQAVSPLLFAPRGLAALALSRTKPARGAMAVLSDAIGLYGTCGETA